LYVCLLNNAKTLPLGFRGDRDRLRHAALESTDTIYQSKKNTRKILEKLIDIFMQKCCPSIKSLDCFTPGPRVHFCSGGQSFYERLTWDTLLIPPGTTATLPGTRSHDLACYMLALDW
jgi:hypothetical protein